MSSAQVYTSNARFYYFYPTTEVCLFVFYFTGNTTLLYWSNWGPTGCSAFPKQLSGQAERLFPWPQTFPTQRDPREGSGKTLSLPSPRHHTGAEPGEIKRLTRSFAAPR